MTGTRLAPLLIVVAAILAGVNAMDATIVGVFYDDAHYVILAKALATGEGYRYINVPGGLPATHFPPGYPFFLSLLWRVAPEFPENIAVFRLANALMLGGVAYVTWCPARRVLQLGVVPAALVALAATVTIPALLFSSNVMSETLFLLLLLPYLALVDSHRDSEGLRTAVLLGVGAALLTLVRSHGIVLLPTLAIVFLARRRWRQAIAAMVAAIVVLLPWQLWVATNDPAIPDIVRGQYGSYTGWFLDGLEHEPLALLAGTVRQNAATIYAVIARTFSVGAHSLLNALAVLAVSILAVAGGWRLARRWTALVLFVAFYMVVVLVWPFSPLRFVWGIWPLLVLTIAAGVQQLWEGDHGSPCPDSTRTLRLRRALAITSLAILALGTIAFNARGYANSWWATAAQSLAPRIQPQLAWVAEHTDSSHVIATSDEGAVYLYTGRLAVPVSDFDAWQYLVDRPPEQSTEDLATIVRTFQPSWVVAWTVPTQQAADALARRETPLLVRSDTLPGGVAYQSMRP